MIIARTPIRYFDATLAFITAHLTSDSSGKLRFEGRNDQAMELLSSMILTDADNHGSDVHQMHHHTFVMGS